ncbi:CehA/McbA family metallohydrolase [Candidatus Hydrogenedentota bacterium]
MRSLLVVFCLLIITGLAVSTASGSEIGKDWEQTPQQWTTPWTTRGTNTTVVFKDRVWMLGGVSKNVCINDVWSSKDGLNWTQVTARAAWSARMRHSSVVFKDHMWVIGGRDEERRYYNDVWKSVDGVNWELVTDDAPWTKRRSHKSVVYDGKIWVIGGYTYPGDDPGTNQRDCLQDVWYSKDGKNWTCATESAPWTARYRHRVLSYKDRMWILGGAIGYTSEQGKWIDGFVNDVWSSTDGKEWEEVTSSASWAPRSSHSAVVHDEAMWILGGRDPKEKTGDVWTSTDGKDWKQVTRKAGWPLRYNHTSVSWCDRIWVIGGLTKNPKTGKTEQRNDVWFSPPSEEVASETDSITRMSDSSMRKLNTTLNALVQENPLHASRATLSMLSGMQGAYTGYFHPTYTTRADAYAKWISNVYSLIANIGALDNAILTTWESGRVIKTRSPKTDFLAETSDQRCVLYFNNGMSSLLPEIKKVAFDLGVSEKIHIRVDPARPAMFDLALSGLRAGTHSYPLVLLATDGKVLHKGKVTLKSVKPGRLKVRFNTEESAALTEVLVVLHSKRGSEFVPDTTPYYPHEQVVLRRPSPQGWPISDDKIWASRGELEVALPPGECRIIASKGTEYCRIDETIKIAEGELLERTFVLKRFTDMPGTGWYSGDDHCHIGRTPSRDEDIMDVLAAQDIHVGHIVQMGDVNGLYFLQSSWAEASQKKRGPHMMVSGQEDPRTTWRGHTLILGNNNTIWSNDNYYVYEDAFKEARRQGAITGYAHAAIGFKAENGASVSIPNELVDFIEVSPALTVSYGAVYHFWNLGFRITLATGSDFPWGGLPGNPRFYTYVDGDFSFDKYMAAMKAGNTFVSTGGAFLDARLNGSLPGSTVSCEKGKTARLSFTASVNPDFDFLDRVEVIHNGDVLEVSKPKGRSVSEHSGKIEIPIEESCWIAVRSYGKQNKGRGGPQYKQYLSAAHTTPFYIDVDGKNFWKNSALTEELDRAESAIAGLEANMNGPARPDLDPDKMKTQAESLRKYIDQARAVYGEISKAAETKKGD